MSEPADRRPVRAAVAAIVLLLAALAYGAAEAGQPSPNPDLSRALADVDARDYASALEHFRKAAEAGERLAQFNLAVMLVQGLGTASQPEEGMRWLRRAADNGLPQAQLALGEFHERGQHVPRSSRDAAEWYRKAAEQGLVEAQVSLATQYFVGSAALAQDDALAARWYERAAAQGHAGAAYIVASMYEKGTGVAKDLRRALHWYLQAAANGERGAELMARDVQRRLDTY